MEFEESGIGEECGVFGCVAAGEWPTQLEVAQVLTLGLVALQHRGQESAGIVTSNGASPPTYAAHKGMGLVSTAFAPEALQKLRYGNLGICHTRYSTTGISELQNCQPFVVDTLHGKIAVAHNGELVNAEALRKKVMRHGVGLSTSSDSELITQLLALTPPLEERDAPNWVARIKNLMTETPTSYSLLVMFKDVIYAVRDPYGNRPLCIGRVVPVSKLHSSGAGEEDTEGWVVSSESCSFQSIGAKYYREVLPGEIVQISKHGVKSLSVVPRPEGDLPAFCIFEYVYFARPDTIFEDDEETKEGRTTGAVGAVQESPVSGSDVEVFTKRSFEQAQTPDEESDILTQKTSTPRPSDKLKRTEKTASYKEKRSRRVTEPVQDSDEEPDILTQKTSTPRSSDKLTRTEKAASSKEKRSRRVTEPVQDSDEEPDILTQKTSTPRPSDKLKRTEKTGQMVYTVRQRCGRQLAIEAPTDADVVSTVPESATPAALGYAQQSGLPYIEVLCKNRYVGRTFIQPNTRLRQLGVAKKFGALTDNFAGKRVVLIDDSIVRGNTISPIIKLLKEAGATEVHIRVASPPIRYPCYMGINIPTKEELIANKPEFQDIAGYIGATSVQYLTVEGLVSAVQEGIASLQEKDERISSSNKPSRRVGHCTACLTGKYPVELEW